MDTMTITDTQIRTLCTEAVDAGDAMQAALCAFALGESPAAYDWLLDEGELDTLATYTRDAARAECARVIAEAAREALAAARREVGDTIVRLGWRWAPNGALEYVAEEVEDVRHWDVLPFIIQRSGSLGDAVLPADVRAARWAAARGLRYVG